MIDDDIRSDLRDFIRMQIATSDDGLDDIVESTCDVFEQVADGDDVNAIAQEITIEELVVYEAIQATWPATTDCDRLDAAFRELDAAGIVARQNFACCQNCGTAEIGGQVAPDQTGDVRGYAFYHEQDTERAYESGSLFLSYGGFFSEPEITADPAPMAAVGQEVVATLRRHGLAVAWNGDVNKRIHVALTWQRRR
jgi:hypothetical protein